MKRAIALSIWVLLLAMALPYAVFAQAPLQAPPPDRINISSTLETVRTDRVNSTQFYLLWNRRIRVRPLGHASYTCGRVVGHTRVCTAIFSLPLGKLTVTGEVHTFRRYTMLITAGTKRYSRGEGTLDVWREGPGTYSLTFVLPRKEG